MVSRATVCNTLNMFVQKGLLRHLVLTEGKLVFDPNVDRHNGKWQVVFFWPMDFTFVCPTEIADFGRKNAAFTERNAQALGASTDTPGEPTLDAA
jgi:peroxiredoxin (alkyl hydroperoxide reductase subunit C)